MNLDPHHTHRALASTLDLAALGLAADESFQVHDLLGGARYTWHGARNYVELDPARHARAHLRGAPFVRSEHDFEYFL